MSPFSRGQPAVRCCVEGWADSLALDCRPVQRDWFLHRLGVACLLAVAPAIFQSPGAAAWPAGASDDPAWAALKSKYDIKDTAGDILESQGWAGYAVASDFKDSPKPMIGGVAAEWVVPDLGKPTKTDVGLAQWIGVGGLLRDDGNMLQAGIRAEMRAGQPHYQVRVTLRPGSAMAAPNVPVAPGDRMAVSIHAVETSPDTWRVVVENKTKNVKLDKNIHFHTSRLTAEWVPFERLREADAFLLPPDFKKAIRMENCRFFVDGTSVAIDSVPHLGAMTADTDKGLIYTPSRDIKDDSFAIKMLPYSLPVYEQMRRIRLAYKTIEIW